MTEGRHRTVKTGLRHYGRMIAAAAAVLSLVLSAPGLLAPARAGVLDENISVQISAPTGTFDEIEGANVVLDYYLVAEAKPVEGYDTYELVTVSPFDGLNAEFNIKISDFEERELNYTNYSRLIAQRAAAIALANVPDDDGLGTEVTGDPVIPAAVIARAHLGDQVVTTRTGADLPKGLYLVIPHGEKLVGYKKTIDAEKAGYWSDEGEWVSPAWTGNPDTGKTDVLVTTAYSETKVYSFSPILLSIPARQITETDDQGQETVTPDHDTGAPGEWVYDVAATIKASEDFRYGMLEINKELTDIEIRQQLDNKTLLPADPMTAVFEVIGTDDNGNVIYRKYVSIVLNAVADKSVKLWNIPVGTNITVQEVYSGGSYSNALVNMSDPMKIVADDPSTQDVEHITVSFENFYNETDHGGGSYTNRYSFTDRVSDDVKQYEGEKGESSEDINLPKSNATAPDDSQK